MGKAHTRASNKYNSANYDSLRVTVRKDGPINKAAIEEFARTHGYDGYNGFVNDAIEEKMKRDK